MLHYVWYLLTVLQHEGQVGWDEIASFIAGGIAALAIVRLIGWVWDAYDRKKR